MNLPRHCRSQTVFSAFWIPAQSTKCLGFPDLYQTGRTGCFGNAHRVFMAAFFSNFAGFCAWHGNKLHLKQLSIIWNRHTLHLAAQLLNSLGSGLVIVRQLLPSGNRVGTGPVRQAALRGTLVPSPLLLPVQVVLHQELQLLGRSSGGGREKRGRERNQGLDAFKGFERREEKWEQVHAERREEWRERLEVAGEFEGERGRGRGESGAMWREPMGEKWCDECSGLGMTGITKKEHSE